jgi:hypothetical protein
MVRANMHIRAIDRPTFSRITILRAEVRFSSGSLYLFEAHRAKSHFLLSRIHKQDTLARVLHHLTHAPWLENWRR